VRLTWMLSEKSGGIKSLNNEQSVGLTFENVSVARIVVT
jgi:hypothetical protein